MRVMVDNNLSPLLARAIDVLVVPDGHQVVALRSMFPADAKDADWIEALGAEGGWTVLSGDVRITRRAAERLAWHRSRLKGFFLAPGWSRMTNPWRKRRDCSCGGPGSSRKRGWSGQARCSRSRSARGAG